MDNRELIQQSAEAQTAIGKQSHIMFDVPATQLTQNLQDMKIATFSANEKFYPDLTNLASAYKDAEGEYIADMVAPFYPVTTLNGKYRVFKERTFYDAPEMVQGKDTPPAKITWGSDYVTFSLYGRALAAYLSNVDRDDAINQYGSAAKWRSVVVQLLTRLLLLDRELTVANLIQTSGNYASGFYAVASPAWSNSAATLQADVATGEDKLLTPRDLLVMGHDVYRTLQTHPAITGNTSVSGPKRKELEAYVDATTLEKFFDSKVIVGKARYNSTPKTDTPTHTRIWRNYCAVMHNAPAPGGEDLAAPFLRTFVFNSQSFPNNNGWAVKSVVDSSTFAGGEVLMVGYFSQEVVFAQKSGYLIKAL